MWLSLEVTSAVARISSCIKKRQLAMNADGATLVCYAKEGSKGLELVVYLNRTCPWFLPPEVFPAHSNGNTPRGRPTTHWQDFEFLLVWKQRQEAKEHHCREACLGCSRGCVTSSTRPWLNDKRRPERKIEKPNYLTWLLLHSKMKDWTISQCHCIGLYIYRIL